MTKENKICWNLKVEALEHTPWKTCFRRISHLEPTFYFASSIIFGTCFIFRGKVLYLEPALNFTSQQYIWSLFLLHFRIICSEQVFVRYWRSKFGTFFTIKPTGSVHLKPIITLYRNGRADLYIYFYWFKKKFSLESKLINKINN